MEAPHWQQLKELFFEAIEMPLSDRAAWMEQINDPEQRASLAQLLADDANAPSILDASSEVLAQLVDPTPEPVAPMKHIGPYRILGELGQGGMGAVYLAERADGMFEQQVALKVIRHGLGSGDILRRFEQERQILAALSHDNIARLLDGGTGAEGQPYFVMERIHGEPITAYCDTHQLSVDERLRLFQNACAAVQYAHQNLVVHRDLKPSNMLVTEDGRLKLLDFGIAKLLAEDRPDPLLTQTGARVLTPAYASPEQLRGDPISTASDVYTLGVILYELLTGQRPYIIPSDQEASFFISTVKPQRPSTAISETHDTEDIGVARSTTAERLRRRLSGDLDTIVLKALRKEPARRYASAEAFLDDIKRHLDGMPVWAQRDTVGYRARKFVRRHRVGVAMAAVLVLMLVGFATAMAFQQAQTARALAQAEVESVKSERVSAFLMGLFEANDPSESLGEEITAKDLLERGLAQAEALSDQPEVQAQLLDVIGQVYRSLGRYDESTPLLEQGLALRRQVLGDKHEDVALSLENLAEIQSASGNYASADSLHQEALAMRREVLGNEPLDVAESLSKVATNLTRQGRYADAESVLRESLSLQHLALGEEDLTVTGTMSTLANVLRRLGKYEEAETMHRETLTRHRKLLGEVHPRVATNLSGLSMVLWRQGRYEEAEVLLRETLAMRRTLLGDEHPDIATDLDNLGLLLKEQGRFEESEVLHRESVVLFRKLLGDDHPNVATGLHNLASVLARQQKYDEAEPIHRESLSLYRRRLGDAHPHVAVSLNNLARVLTGQGRYDEAIALLHEALVMRRTLLGDEHPDVANSLSNLGSSLQKQGKYQEAEPFLREALVLRRKLLGNEHPSTLTSLSLLAFLMAAQEAYEDAEPLYREALALTLAQHGESQRLIGYFQSELGACLLGMHRYAEAETMLVQALPILETKYGPEHVHIQRARERLVSLYTAWGQPEKAQPYQ